MIKKLDLKRIRKERGLTQTQLAKRLDYPQSYVSYIESGKSSPSKEFQETLQRELKIEDLYLYALETDDNEGAMKTFLARIDEQQNTINRLLDMLDRRDARIKELEQEVNLLHSVILKSSK